MNILPDEIIMIIVEFMNVNIVQYSLSRVNHYFRNISSNFLENKEYNPIKFIEYLTTLKEIQTIDQIKKFGIKIPKKLMCFFATINGNLDVLKCAVSNGYNLHSSLTIFAAENGQFDCLKYLHENGCELFPSVCSRAAKNGNLDCLKYSHEKVFKYIENI